MSLFGTPYFDAAIRCKLRHANNKNELMHWSVSKMAFKWLHTSM